MDVAFTFDGQERRAVLAWTWADRRYLVEVRQKGTMLQGFEGRRLDALLDELEEAGLRFDRLEAHRAASIAARVGRPRPS